MGETVETGGWRTTGMKEALQAALTIVQPLIELLVTIAAPIALAWITSKLATFFNIQSDEKKAQLEGFLRDALHKAAENALTYGMTKYGLRGVVTSNMSESILDLTRKANQGDAPSKELLRKVMDSALDEYLIPKMPETINKLGASPEDLANIILSKVGKV